MPLYEPTVPARYTAPLVEALRERPVAGLEDVLTEAGVGAAMLADPGAALTMSAFDALLTTLAERSGRDDLGFELGLRIAPRHHGALAAPLTRCATLDDVLRMLARYHRLITPSFFLHYRRHADRGEFVWRPAAPMSPGTLRAMEEIFAVSFHSQVGAALEHGHAPYDVYLSIAAPRHAARYRRLAAARFHFGHLKLPEVRVVLDGALLDAPLRRHDPAQALPETADLAGLQRRVRGAARWSEWVVMMLREAECAQPTLRELAALLSVSPRTLSRRLEAEGRALRDLALAVRVERARRMLADPRQPIAQVSWRLGYDDPANFSHAFRAVEGRSPRAYRASLHPCSAAAGARRGSSKDGT